MTKNEMVLLAEEYRSELPPGFDAVSQELALLLEDSLPIENLTRGKRGSINHRIRQAVLDELRTFLCTESKRYKDVKTHATTITRASLTSVAAYVAGAVGISTGMAMACVAFVALAIVKVGVGTFCRLAGGK